MFERATDSPLPVAAARTRYGARFVRPPRCVRLPRTVRCARFVVPIFVTLLLIPPVGAQNHSGVVVNSVPLDAQTLASLQRIYPVPIRPGRYWYDPVAGVYGLEGGPVMGQMSAGLQVGGPLRADASRGNSGVHINGRHITQGEKAYIERACSTVVAPRRYWVNAQGLGGFEGEGAIFNLARCNPPTQARSGGSMSRTFCDPDGSCRSTGILGSILTVPRQ